MRIRRRETSVARQVLVLQLLVVLVLVVAAGALATYDARQDVRDHARDRAVAVATSLADSPTVRTGVGTADPTAVLQPYATQVEVDTGVDFVVVMGPDRTRYTHPDPAQIGKAFIGDLGSAPRGKVFTQEYAGTLGPSMRAVAPVRSGDRVIALVAVGITLDRIDDQLRRSLVSVGLAALAVLLVGIGGAWLINRRLQRQTHGMGEQEITRMYEYYRAVLHAVREGLLLVDAGGRVQLVNDEAIRLLNLPADVAGRPVSELGLPPALVEAISGSTPEDDDIYVTGDHVLVVSSSPALWNGDEVGAVVTLRDRTELVDVTGELDVARGLSESLRSQNHEAANRLHTVVSLIELGRPEEAVAFATAELQIAQRLTDQVVGAVDEPVLAALLLGKTAQAAERGIELTISGDLRAGVGPVEPRDLVTVVGNLLDNAMDAVSSSVDRRVAVQVRGGPDQVRIVVGDSGPGIPSADSAHVLERGWSTKTTGSGIGLALVGQVARRHGGSVTVGTSALGGAEFVVELGRRS
ncbi:sensor histidine kinase [Nocardioides marmoriginsengisoli]|uniref:histidine kinase n=1 Tax=Nocardioides marmoriginsengisoli TaxID=661483 RepID=A0A3N0CM85_9ACTN|nr:sensor histidine kinase [Nocardioides marmoriginsengisoli]RNL64421.1 sensor histidine kinase [Nocardioides marmoriginsengisoli]